MAKRIGGFIVFDYGTRKPINKLTEEEQTEYQDLINKKIINTQ